MKQSKGITVLSLFDGMSCGRIALERAGIEVDRYYASEIDKHAISVAMKNYPDTIQLGDVRSIEASTLPKIDLIIGGSPCQSFSFAGKCKGMSTKDQEEVLTLQRYLELRDSGFEFEGQSYLFWEYMRLLKELNPKYFFLENVMMGDKWEKVLSRAIGVKPIEINSALVSAQNRKRLYWTNIGMVSSGLFGFMESIIPEPKDKGMLLKDILQDDVDQKYYLSQKMIDGFQRHKERHKEKGTGFGFDPKTGEEKGNCLRANGALCPTDNMIISHNLQKRSADRPALQKNKNAGGSGHLTKADGKSYCLDTGNTQAVEIRKVKQLSTNNKSNGGTQPYQQDRIYDINGISPALQAQLPFGSTMINTPRIRRLTPIECERLQTVPDDYTLGVSDTQRYRMLGNGWTVDVIAHFFSYINIDIQ